MRSGAPPKMRPYWYQRGALRDRTEVQGQRRANDANVDVKLYEVAGGYEARDASAPAPKETHALLIVLKPIRPEGKKPRPAPPVSPPKAAVPVAALVTPPVRPLPVPLTA